MALGGGVPSGTLCIDPINDQASQHRHDEASRDRQPSRDQGHGDAGADRQAQYSEHCEPGRHTEPIVAREKGEPSIRPQPRPRIGRHARPERERVHDDGGTGVEDECRPRRRCCARCPRALPDGNGDRDDQQHRGDAGKEVVLLRWHRPRGPEAQERGSVEEGGCARTEPRHFIRLTGQPERRVDAAIFQQHRHQEQRRTGPRPERRPAPGRRAAPVDEPHHPQQRSAPAGTGGSSRSTSPAAARRPRTARATVVRPSMTRKRAGRAASPASTATSAPADGRAARRGTERSRTRAPAHTGAPIDPVSRCTSRYANQPDSAYDGEQADVVGESADWPPASWSGVASRPGRQGAPTAPARHASVPGWAGSTTAAVNGIAWAFHHRIQVLSIGSPGSCGIRVERCAATGHVQPIASAANARKKRSGRELHARVRIGIHHQVRG